MDTQRKVKRLAFLEYLKRREQKHQPITESDETAKRENLLAHRCVIVENIASALQVVTIPYAIIGGHAVTFHGRPRMTDDIDILVSPQDTQTAVAQLRLQQITPLKTGGFGGVAPDGMLIDVVAPNQRWVVPAVSQAIHTQYGPMVSAPFLVITKMWDSRGAQDETDVLGVLKGMTDAELNVTRQLVRQFLPNDVEDLESLIAMRTY
ncbi:MAG TPA: hypothetical protein VMV69_13320 [Pirellulales bacterium]|nr:hypothetical protein [Pirellulales bacterium]